VPVLKPRAPEPEPFDPDEPKAKLEADCDADGGPLMRSFSTAPVFWVVGFPNENPPKGDDVGAVEPNEKPEGLAVLAAVDEAKEKGLFVGAVWVLKLKLGIAGTGGMAKDDAG
jgi:hypothetical protein